MAPASASDVFVLTAPSVTVAFEAAIDRAARSLPSTDVSAVLSVALGRTVSTADVEARSRKIATYRAHLAALLELGLGVTQRTPEWYAARQTMITASDIAQALGCAKFGTQKDFFKKKCGLPAEQTPFDPTVPPLKWGVMFEPVAGAIYSALNGGLKVHEFGLLRHPTVPFLGASPDGITEDGVMLEIKCPWRRKIDGTVPLQYYYQIQGQLAVCGLDECDYFECEFGEAHQDPLGPTGVVDCEWDDAAREGRAGAFVESLVREKESSYAASCVCRGRGHRGGPGGVRLESCSARARHPGSLPLLPAGLCGRGARRGSGIGAPPSH